VATSDAAFRGGACPTPEYTIAYTGNYTTSADANRAAVAVARKLAAIMHTSSRQESHSTHRLVPRPNRGASLSSQRVSI